MNKELINKIVIGTRSLSGDMGYVEKKEIRKIIEKSITYGLRHFDTAPFYGNELIDNILKDYNKEIVVDTKTGYNKKLKIKSFSLDDIKYSLHSSLEKFKKINIFYIHNPRNEIKNWDPIFHLLVSFKKQGLIKYAGISIARDYIFENNILNFFDYVQDDINLLRTSPLQYLKKYKGHIYARSPFASGCLSGQLNLNSKFKKKDYRYDWLNESRLFFIIKQVHELKKLYKKDIRKLAINYLINNKKIKKVIVGLKKIKHLSFLSYLDTKIENSIIKKIDKLNKHRFYLNDKEIGY